MSLRIITTGRSRFVLLADGLAFKTPYLFKYSDLIEQWRLARRAGKRRSIEWLFKEWWLGLFRLGCEHNKQEVRRWQQMGTQEVNGVGLCRIRKFLPWGLLVIMDRADPLGRTVSLEEDNAARILIGMNRDTGKPDTFGFVNGNVVVVDYGWWIPSQHKR